MSLYQSPDNSADVNRHNINLPSFANFSNDGLLISDHSGSVTCASSENSEFNNIQTKQECNSEVGFDYRSGSAFFNLFLSYHHYLNQ